MKKSLLILIIIASALTLVGLIFMGISFALGGLKFKNVNLLGEYNIAPNEHLVFVEFDSIEISSMSETVVILPSTDGKTKIVADETKNMYSTVEITGNTLKVRYVDARMWFERMGVQVDIPTLTLYLPEGSYKALKVSTQSAKIKCDTELLSFENAELSASSGAIEFSANVTKTLSAKTSSGKIELAGMKPSALTVQASSGKLELCDIVCDTLVLKTSSGKAELENIRLTTLTAQAHSGAVELENVVAAGSIKIDTSSGNIDLDRCDANELSLSASSGRIRGTLLSGKIFNIESNSGNIICPPSTNDGGICTASTSSGNIVIEIVK